MKKILLMADEASGSGSQPAAASSPATAATPPQAAELVAKGKSEREALLERENAKLRGTVTKLAEVKRKVEINNAHLADENQRLKQVPAPAKPAAKEKLVWLGFMDN